MTILTELTESQLIPSRSGYRKYTGKQLTEMLYFHIIAFRILSCEDYMDDFVHAYAQKTKYWGKFNDWHQTATDLYFLTHANVSNDPEMKLSKPSSDYISMLQLDDKRLMAWIKSLASRNGISETYGTRFFVRLDVQLKITNGSWRSIRRLAMNWPDLTHHEKQLTMTRLLQILRARCPRSDLLAPLNKLAQHANLELKDVHNPEESTTLSHIAAQHRLREDDGGAPAADVSTTSSDIAPLVKPFKKVMRRNAK